MNHLTHEQLSALLDGALSTSAREQAERHVAECPTCRDALAALADQERTLSTVLQHDPGDAYFESFAARVEDRIRAAGLQGAQARQGDAWLGWLRSPRRLATVGAVAVALAGAGVVMLTTRLERADLGGLQTQQESGAKEQPTPPESQTGPAAEAPQNRIDLQKKADEFAEAVPAPVTDAKVERDQVAAREELKDAARNVAPSRLKASRRTAAGEDVPVASQAAPAPAQPPVTEKTSGRLLVQPPAAPMAREAAGLRAGEAQRDERATTAGELCGQVLDANRNPVARARVTLVENGQSVPTDSQGRFCIDAAPGEHALSVMAVGFQETRLTARTGTGSELAVRLNAVPVLGTSRPMASAPDATEPTYGYLAREATDVFSALPDSPRARVREAQSLTSEGRTRGSVSRLEQAAQRWEQVIPGLRSEGMVAEARYRLAEARVLAWQLSPNAARRAAAMTAVRRALESWGSGARGITLRTWLRDLAP